MLDELTSTISYSKVERKIVDFIRDYAYSSSVEGVVLGLSGGVDSSVTATLLVKSLGRENVLALIMPHSGTSRVDVEDAISAASEAYKKWRLVPAPKRGEILYNVASKLWQHKEEFSKDMTREMGKVLNETRGDTQEAIDMTYYMAGEGRRLFGMTTPSEMENKFNMTVRQPLGVCSFITPWNFPMAIPSWKMMPALICGNTIVIKPATDTPLSVVNLMRICQEEGIPDGVVNMVTGSGSKLGNPLIQNPAVKIVSFTGSTEIGRKVSESCASSFKHASLEMGGKNVQIVMDDAKLDLAVDGEDGLKSYKNYFLDNNVNYDIVISDIEMPNMNGIEMSREITKINRDQKIIIISAYSDKDYLIDLINIGVEGFMQKPLSLAQIFEILYESCSSFYDKDKINLVDGYSYNRSLKILFLNEEKIDLSDKELKFLDLLMRNINQSFSSVDIFSHIYFDEPEKEYSEDSIKGLLKRLRKKIPSNLIVNKRQLGYSINLK